MKEDADGKSKSVHLYDVVILDIYKCNKCGKMHEFNELR